MSESMHPIPESADRPLKPGLRERLWEKAPEIVIEAIFLMLAVLLALAIDSWQKERAQHEEAAIALASIRAEMKSNQRSVQDTLKDLNSSLKTLEPMVKPDAKSEASVKVGFSISLLSTASWTMAQNNQALTQIGIVRSTELAKLYELQGWFNDGQRRANAALTELSVFDGKDWTGVQNHLRRVQREFLFLQSTAEGLLQEYADQLE